MMAPFLVNGTGLDRAGVQVAVAAAHDEAVQTRAVVGVVDRHDGERARLVRGCKGV